MAGTSKVMRLDSMVATVPASLVWAIGAISPGCSSVALPTARTSMYWSAKPVT
ncbi:hypothetical protein D3C83_180090 [compost metagenome]